MPVSPEDIKNMHKYETLLLMTTEKLMRKYSWVPDDVLKKSSGLSAQETEFRLGHLMEKDMIKSSSVPYRGYQLTFTGYDALAVLSLVKKGTISALGCLIGVGKESTVYEALGTGVLALKIHRVGQRSFQSARLNRSFMPEWKHFPWIFASTYSARQEYEALKALRKGGVSVPVPVAINRNAIAMTYIAGRNIQQITLENPGEIFDTILENVKKAYALGYIHNDLSEYNVMFDEKEVWLIDWPQWTETSHPNAKDILMHDLENITGYFSRKYGIACTPEDAFKTVVG
ncbi:RIO kinase 2 [Methanomicrobium sp. W14]|uniref:RIO1 family regulatory kinase/ATPase domain-containing protein n=1 Tax=Methanomicrobium sp. W14 TaxID=2817839 RepID=UPI001AE2DBAE|nr:RIO1 family regulatory kinase/ATPase [Methanomicrobium sp. W14]MBP2134322.1 RIO kinase 2 [Methanomicrobium sp. W14]